MPESGLAADTAFDHHLSFGEPRPEAIGPTRSPMNRIWPSGSPLDLEQVTQAAPCRARSRYTGRSATLRRKRSVHGVGQHLGKIGPLPERAFSLATRPPLTARLPP